MVWFWFLWLINQWIAWVYREDSHDCVKNKGTFCFCYFFWFWQWFCTHFFLVWSFFHDIFFCFGNLLWLFKLSDFGREISHSCNYFCHNESKVVSKVRCFHISGVKHSCDLCHSASKSKVVNKSDAFAPGYETSHNCDFLIESSNWVSRFHAPGVKISTAVISSLIVH